MCVSPRPQAYHGVCALGPRHAPRTSMRGGGGMCVEHACVWGGACMWVGGGHACEGCVYGARIVAVWVGGAYALPVGEGDHGGACAFL